MGKESYIGGDYLETTGGNTKIFAGENIENSSAGSFAQKGEDTGVGYNVNSAPPSLGNLDLISININTSFDVCHDEVIDFSDYKNFWILEDKGKYYHWLNNRTNTDDQIKPDPLPITLASTDNFILKAIFKTKAPMACQIRIKDSDNKFIFQEEQHPKKNTDEEYEIVFTCDTKPYKDTVQYLENFTLNFEYSEDGTTWIPMKSVKFCLYLSWKKPLFSTFETASNSKETMQIKCSSNRNKENICETLLWIGCNQSKGLGKEEEEKKNDIIKKRDEKLKDIEKIKDKKEQQKQKKIINDDAKRETDNVKNNEEQIIDSIFDIFKTLKIVRRRETKWNSEGLGYWRNVSMGDFVRGLRTLLKDGEARCGEWTDFFQHILLAQGMSVGNDTIGICTEYGFSYTPYFPTYIEKTPSYSSTPTSIQFAVKNAIHTDITNFQVTTGDSPGQGNPKSQPLFIDHYWFYYTKGKRFYDASYGKTYSKTDSNLKEYCKDNLNSIFMTSGINRAGNPIIPGSIEKNNLHNFVRATKSLF